MSIRQSMVGLLAGAVLAFAGPAHAASIDFTGAFGASLAGTSSYTSGLDPDGVTWTLEAKPGTAHFNHATTFGLGISGGGGYSSEAELPEYFELTFNKPVDNVVIGLKRLLYITGFLPYFEGGYVSVNGGPAQVFFQTNFTVQQGNFALDLGDNITSIIFSGLGLRMPGVSNPLRDFERHGFKLASLQYSLDRVNVPEPASMTLLGLGFAGAGLALRRRRRVA